MAIAGGQQEELERSAFWLRYPSWGLRPIGDATVRSYLYFFRRFHQFLEGREPSQEAAAEFVRRMEASGNSPRSIGRHIYALRSYFAFKGVDLDLGAPAFQKRLPRWLSDDEWARLLQAAERPFRTSCTQRKWRRYWFHCLGRHRRSVMVRMKAATEYRAKDSVSIYAVSPQ